MVKAIQTNGLAGLPSWKAAETVQECINKIQSNEEKFRLKHVTRKALQEPHSLANRARTTGQSRHGWPAENHISELGVASEIDAKWCRII